MCYSKTINRNELRLSKKENLLIIRSISTYIFYSRTEPFRPDDLTSRDETEFTITVSQAVAAGIGSGSVGRQIGTDSVQPLEKGLGRPVWSRTWT